MRGKTQKLRQVLLPCLTFLARYKEVKVLFQLHSNYCITQGNEETFQCLIKPRKHIQKVSLHTTSNELLLSLKQFCSIFGLKYSLCIYQNYSQ